MPLKYLVIFEKLRISNWLFNIILVIILIIHNITSQNVEV